MYSLKYYEFQNCITVVFLCRIFGEHEYWNISSCFVVEVMAFVQHWGVLDMGQKSVQEHRKINAEVLTAWHIEQEGIWEN